jgi:tetratricopeptide (TPR) repeat protein
MIGIPVIFSLGILLFQSGADVSTIQQNQQTFRVMFSRASQLRSQGDFEKAVGVLQKALILSQQNRLYYQHRKCLVMMAFLEWNIGSISESESYFRQALAAFERAGDRRSGEFCSHCLRLIQFYNQGKEERKAKLYHRSLERFENAILLGRETGFPDFALKCLRQQGLTYWDMSQIDLFFENNKKGLEISRRLHHRTDEGRCLNNIGVYYQKRNDFSQAVVYLENALSLIRSVNDQQTEAECLSNLGILYRELGNFKRAHFYLSSALELDKRIGDSNAVAIDMNNIGAVFLRNGIDNQNRQDLLQGLGAFQDCISLQGNEKTSSYNKFTALNNIGIIQNELKNYAEARRSFTSAIAILGNEKFLLERCHVLNNIGASHLYEGNARTASAYYRQAYDLGSKNSLENVVLESCVSLGKCYENSQEFPLALLFYREAINALENMRSKISSEFFMIGFARNKLVAYEKAIHLIANQYTAAPSSSLLEELFNLVERAKARAFLENINEAQREIDLGYSSDLKERQQEITKNISELARMLKSPKISEERRQILNNELECEEDEYVRVISDIKAGAQNTQDSSHNDICSIEEVQSQIVDRRTILLEYFVGDSESYLISISSRWAKLHVLPGRIKIESSLRAYLKMISDDSVDYENGFKAAERIGRELIPSGFREELKDLRALIVIPDGVLHCLPFETLRIRDEHDSKYLIETVAISYCPSASSLLILKNTRNLRTWKKGLLAIGGPQYEQKMPKLNDFMTKRRAILRDLYNDYGYKFHSLPFSKKEVSDIAKLFPK